MILNLRDARRQPVSSDAPWLVAHLGHFAWFQRAVLAGDFRPDLRPRSEYVIRIDGRSEDPSGVEPICSTCGLVPENDDLELFERATGTCGFLEPYRSGRLPWPPPTREDSCSWCNTPRLELAVEAPIKLCFSCLLTLRRER